MSTPLLENILNQPNAIETVAAYQLGRGRAALEKAAEILKSKKRVVVSGMGASLFASMRFHYLLLDAGYAVTTIETAELLYFQPGLIDRDTAVVLVSRSGESVEITKLLPLVKERGAALIGVVNVPDSTLANAAEQCLLVASPADQLVAIQTYTGTVALFILLAAAISGELARASSDFSALTRTLREWVPQCVSASSGWSDFLSGSWPLYLLGRGPALASVAEGVLLMHETAKAPAIGMSVAQFRHGPVEVTDGRFRALLFGTQSSTAALDAALATDAARMGGQVRWIGPPMPSTEPLQEWPDSVPVRCNSLVEIIPVQMAAYRKAELNGVPPGEFRWAPLVTSTETGFSQPGAQ